jgi:hypothetical protein
MGLRGTRIHVPANALVGPTGAAPTGMLTAYLATLNTADGEAPGDWGAMLGGKETNLISYGATFVEFRDAAGVKYKLASGMEAKVEMFAPPSVLPSAPAAARFWSYDEKDGYWKESGGANFVAGSGSFEGRVKYFSTINTDVEKDDDACCLHVGEVFYGNVGSRERLDFTVVGPAVNEASRIAAMCRSVEQPVLVSDAFAKVDGMRDRLVSVGRYALRGPAAARAFHAGYDPSRLAGSCTPHVNYAGPVRWG